MTAPAPGILFYQSDANATGSQTAWTNVGQNFTFNSNGNLVSPSGGGITIPGLTVGGQAVGNVSLNFASGALTQFASSGGTASRRAGRAEQALPPASSNRWRSDDNGVVVGTFSNGQNIDLAEITLSHFNGTNYLQALDGQACALPPRSPVQRSRARRERSPVRRSKAPTPSIADEFAKLIVTQQAYSAEHQGDHHGQRHGSELCWNVLSLIGCRRDLIQGGR